MQKIFYKNFKIIYQLFLGYVATNPNLKLFKNNYYYIYIYIQVFQILVIFLDQGF